MYNTCDLLRLSVHVLNGGMEIDWQGLILTFLEARLLLHLDLDGCLQTLCVQEVADVRKHLTDFKIEQFPDSGAGMFLSYWMTENAAVDFEMMMCRKILVQLLIC